MAGKIKVLIVDDATFMQKAIREILESDPEIEVVGTAKNGLECLKLIKELRPDVVTLDVDMPVMDGIKTVRHIMIESPVPVVMLSSLSEHGDITFEAMRLGVVDFLPKPSGAISHDIHDVRQQIIDRVKIATSVTMENIRRVKLKLPDAQDELYDRYGYQSLDYIVTIGTTLGGPNTVINMMSRLPSALPATMVVIQEIAPKIVPSFAKQFAEQTSWRVEAAEQGKVLEQGVCYICSNEEPLVVERNSKNEVCLTESGKKEQPLNELFSSASKVFGTNTIGVLLTGIGNDGTVGFSKIRENSGITIAQSTDTCVFPNLTQCAIETGKVDYVVDGNAIASQIESVVHAEH
ncbi:MAG: chemotaxis protein CheB [Chloroflexota bacterium]